MAIITRQSMSNERSMMDGPSMSNEGVQMLNLEKKTLKEAVENNDCDLIEVLLRGNANPNRVYVVDYIMDETLLHCAARYGYTEAVKLLLAYGADVNARDHQGRTPLHATVVLGKREVVEVLLKHKADLEMGDAYARTPMHSAANLGDTVVMKLLLEHGANVNAKDLDGATPLHIAIESTTGKACIEDWLNTAKLLIVNGADVKAETEEGEKPLGLAPSQHYKSFAKLFKNLSQNVVLQNEPLPKTSEQHIEALRKWVCALSRGIPAVSGGSFMGQKPRPYRELIQYVIEMEKKILTPPQGIEKIRNTLRNMGLESRFKNECASEITALSTLNDVENHRRNLSLR